MTEQVTISNEMFWFAYAIASIGNVMFFLYCTHLEDPWRIRWQLSVTRKELLTEWPIIMLILVFLLGFTPLINLATFVAVFLAPLFAYYVVRPTIRFLNRPLVQKKEDNEW